LKSNYEGIAQIIGHKRRDLERAPGRRASLVVLSYDARSPASYQRAAHLSFPDDRHNLRDRASVPGRRTAKSLAAIHDPVESPRFT